jgi:3-oxoadipate enol-lactonase
MARLGQDVLDILDAHGIEQAHFVGLSLGGMVGQWLLAHAGHRIGRAVLANTSAHYPDPAAWNARIDAVRLNGMGAVASAVVARWFTAEFAEENPETIATLKSGVLDVNPEGYVGCCAAIRDMDLREAGRLVTNGLVDKSNKDEIEDQLRASVPPWFAQDAAVEALGRRYVFLDCSGNRNGPDDPLCLGYVRGAMSFVAGDLAR